MTAEDTERSRQGEGAALAAVALVGFMGAGKTAVGRSLAAALGVRLVDTDELIACEAGPIDTIFATRGETWFRGLETTVVTAAVADALIRPSVMSLGGGAVQSATVREALGRLPHVVWLTASAEVLWERVRSGGGAVRPLAADESRFRALLAERRPLYREVATMVVDTAGQTADEIALELASRLRGSDEAQGAHMRGRGQ